MAELAAQIAESGRAEGALIDCRTLLHDALQKNKLDEGSAWSLWSFFEEPIWLSGECWLGSGQHRVCAVKSARAVRCLMRP